MKSENNFFDLPERIVEPKSCNSSLNKPRLKIAVRNQVEMTALCLDDCLPEDHKVRLVWDFVNHLDLSAILGEIKTQLAP